MKEFMKKCLDWRVLTCLAVLVGVTAVVAPNWLSVVLPFAILALCPLSMIVMMAMMGGGKNDEQAVAALKERYAKGEITQQQFEQMKREISTRG